jgi:F0F1-type ATP synthase assembly protein I
MTSGSRGRRSKTDPLPDPRLDPLVVGDDEPRRTPPRLAAMKAMGGVGTLGLEIVLSVLLGLFAGLWADGKLGTSPWITLVGSGFGVAAAVRAVLREMRRMRVEAAREEAAEGNPRPLWETDAERDHRRREARGASGAGPDPGSSAP